VVWNAAQNAYMVVWWGDDSVGGLVDNEYENFGQQITANGIQTGFNDFPISDLGGLGNPSYVAVDPAVVWNATANEYLVVWYGDDNEGNLVVNELEIFGQRLNENGTPQGANDFRISDMGGLGNPSHSAFDPAVVWNAAQNVYMVVWWGDDSVGGLVDNEYEIFGQQINANGIQMGFNDFPISDMGGLGNPSYDAVDPAVVWNATANEYLVVWSGDDTGGGLADNEFEIFGQRLDAASTVPPVPPVGANDFRISDMGGTGVNPFNAGFPAVAYNSTRNQFLVVWHGDDDIGGLVDDEIEIFGQRLGDTLIFADGFESGDVSGWDAAID
jgi:hypothetical protein